MYNWASVVLGRVKNKMADIHILANFSKSVKSVSKYGTQRGKPFDSSSGTQVCERGMLFLKEKKSQISPNSSEIRMLLP